MAYTDLTSGERIALWLAFVLSVIVLIVFFTVPGYSGVSESATDVGGSLTVVRTTYTNTMFGANGWQAVWVGLFPIVLTGIPLLLARSQPARTRAIVAVGVAIILAVGIMLGSASVGIYYVPSMIAMVVAADIARRTARRERMG